MRRRIAPLLLALTVAGAPVALELCHIACASLSSQADARTGMHSHAPHMASCHDETFSPAPLSLHAHRCDHGNDLPAPAGIASARQDKLFTSLVAAIPLIGSFAGMPPRPHTAVQSQAPDRSAARIDRILPLRI
jgi:hypothetical protein